MLDRLPWSSLSGYLKKRKKEHFVTYSLVLADYGGDTDKARNEYRKALVEEMTAGKGIYDQVVGQTVIGGEGFISWIRENILEKEEDKEAPAHREIKRHGARDEVMKAIVRRSGKTLEQIQNEKGLLRRVAMDLLYRHGGMRNRDIGVLFNVDYTAVSHERRRLRVHMEKEGKIERLVRNYEAELSNIKK